MVYTLQSKAHNTTHTSPTATDCDQANARWYCYYPNNRHPTYPHSGFNGVNSIDYN